MTDRSPVRNAFAADLDPAVLIWEHASVSVMDIRHNLISPGEEVRDYRVPANTFLYTAGDGGLVHLDGTPYHVERFGIFHGGKGTSFSIRPEGDWMECYMVLYKAGTPFTARRGINRLVEQRSPFEQQYGYSTGNPIFFMERLRRMYERWRSSSPLRRFYVKAAFYQLVYEIYEELAAGEIAVMQPDIVVMAHRYIREHYHELISIQSLSDSFGISISQLNRLFKQKTGKSPQELLMEIRLDAARGHLVNEHATLKEIASATGFYDEYQFSRMFKKRYGISPDYFRQNHASHMRNMPIGEYEACPYTGERMVSHSSLKDKGTISMRNRARNHAFLTAALSLMLLLSACGGGANSGSSAGAAAPPSASPGASAESGSAVGSEAAAAAGTKTVRTVNGDVEVSANPQRVVASGYWVGDLLAMGITPVGVESFYTEDSAYADKLRGKDVTVLDKWDPESIMALEPDLIITGYADDYEKLGKIAPTVVVPWNVTKEERLPLIAQALGKEAEDGQALLDAYNKKAADYREKLGQAGVLDKTVTVFRNGMMEGGLEITWSGYWGGGIVYETLGMKLPETVRQEADKDAKKWARELSFEVLPKYSGDYILLSNASPEAVESLNKNTIWNTIPAVRQGKVMGMDAGFLYFGDITSLNAQLDTIAARLLELAAK